MTSGYFCGWVGGSGVKRREGDGSAWSVPNVLCACEAGSVAVQAKSGQTLLEAWQRCPEFVSRFDVS